MPMLILPRLPVLSWGAIGSYHPESCPAVMDQRYLTWTSSGRAAIAYALMEANIGKGDQVLVPTYHCPTMVAPIVAVGATPVFYPITDMGTPNLDAIATLDLSGIRGMIAAHFFGLPQPMSKIRAFCDQHSITLIEDCAHAMFGKADGQPIGSWGDYAIASMTKFFPVLEGGCLVSSKHVLQQLPMSRSALGEIRNIFDVLEMSIKHGRLLGLNGLLSLFFWLKGILRPGQTVQVSDTPPARPDVVKEGEETFKPSSVTWHAPYCGTRWIARHDNRERNVGMRRRNYALLVELLEHQPGVKPLFPALPPDAAPYVFPLWVEQADQLYQQFRASGMPVFRWDWRWPDLPKFANDAGELWAHGIYQIGCHQDLSEKDIRAIADFIKQITHNPQNQNQ